MISLDLDGMNPMQLAAAQGLRFMMQYVMKVDLTSILWVWGPVTQYQIRLEVIDSSGDGASDVMEILIREGAQLSTRELILDDFMAGFLFTLYRQKWSKFGWYFHVLLRALDFGIVCMIIYLCAQLKGERRAEQHAVCGVLAGLIVLFLAE